MTFFNRRILDEKKNKLPSSFLLLIKLSLRKAPEKNRAVVVVVVVVVLVALAVVVVVLKQKEELLVGSDRDIFFSEVGEKIEHERETDFFD